MLFRVLLVTLFLGGALAVNVEALADFSNVRNATIVTLIVGTYGLTIFYAVMLRLGANRASLAVTQLSLDIVVIMVLVDVSQGIDSPFLFLFLLTVVNAAIVMGRRAALYAAAAVTIALGMFAIERIGLFAAIPAPGAVWKDTVFRWSLNASAAAIIGVLSGYLTERLGEVTTELAEQRVNIRELKALNENILASLASGLLTVDSQQTVIFFNKAAESITQRSSDEVLGRPLSEVLPEIATFIDRGDADETEARQESVLVRPDNTTMFLGFSTSDLRNADDESVGKIVIFQDLSEIKRLEGEMRRSERLAAVGKLSAAIAHEIRNPLASISGSVEMLSDNEGVTEDDQTLMRIIVREVDRLDELISDFLEYSRPRSLDLRAHEVEPLVRDVVKLFGNRRAQDIDLEVEIEEDLPQVSVDEEAFQQVLWNMLNNAAEAQDGDGKIRLSVQRQARHVEIRVDDAGDGIPEDDLERIFQPFFTTKDGGTGLGLATIYRIIQDHQAEISVVAKGDLGGACFRVKLPAVGKK